MSTVNGIETMRMTAANQEQQSDKEKEQSFNKLARRIASSDVYWCDLGDVHEQYNKYMIKKIRPCIILSDDTEDMKKDVFTILPIKTFRGESNNIYFITKRIELGEVESLLCLDQIRPINKRSIREYIGTLTPPQRVQIDDYLEEYLKMHRGYAELRQLLEENNLTVEDIKRMIMNPSSNDEGESSCKPFELPNINIR